MTGIESAMTAAARSLLSSLPADSWEDGYPVAVFGSPGDDGWAWRFEGHHLSVNVTVTAGRPLVGPLFLGAMSAQVRDQ